MSKYCQMCKKIFWNFSADSLNCGPILDNLEINPQVCTTVTKKPDKKIPIIWYSLYSVFIIRSWCVECNWHGSLPSFEQRNKVVQKCVITMCSVGDSFIAFEFFLSWHIIIKDPILTSHGYPWSCVFFKTLNGLKYFLGKSWWHYRLIATSTIDRT